MPSMTDKRRKPGKAKSAGGPSRAERVAGCLLGGAVGDALGAPIEFMRLPAIRKRFGPAGLTDYAPAYGRLGAITDDTQMTLFTAEGLLRAVCRGRLKGICHAPTAFHFAYLRWLKTQGYECPGDGFRTATEDLPRFDPDGTMPNGWLSTVRELRVQRGPGNTCLAALRSGRFGRVEDREPINDSKGCGGVMRAAPAAGTFREGVLLAVNHGGDSDSTGSIAGNILGAALGRSAIPAPWLERLELRDVIEQVAADLVTEFEESAEWWRKYPGC